VYHIHWLHAKAGQDRWEEEEELLTSKFEWVINYFRYQAKSWQEKYSNSKAEKADGAACYVARQCAVCDQLAEQGE
ncbi:hypothetical protein EDD16DRAFT_1444298, partial [Pisolithus croceorrhizus]